MGAIRVLAVSLLLSTVASSARAQSITLGGAAHLSLQRLDGDPTLNRLDGDSPGGTLMSTVRSGRWRISGEVSRDRTIRHRESTTLTVNGRPATVHSELAHDLWDVAVLGGYGRPVTRRFELSVAGGISHVTFHRSFTSDAGELVLVPPSEVPTTPVVTRYLDRFVVWTVEGRETVRLTSRVGLIVGIRAQPIRLRADLSGRSVRTFGGAEWRLK